MTDTVSVMLSSIEKAHTLRRLIVSLAPSIHNFWLTEQTRNRDKKNLPVLFARDSCTVLIKAALVVLKT